MLESRTVAGPSRALQWALSGGVHRLVACAARPRGVPAAVTEAGLVAEQDLVRAEGVTVGAARRWLRDPLPGRGLHQLAQHACKPRRPKRGAAPPGYMSDIGQRHSSVALAG
jgi:hypothetical protein